jgi:hypothetical protein
VRAFVQYQIVGRPIESERGEPITSSAPRTSLSSSPNLSMTLPRAMAITTADPNAH